jgi:hypothetical protein
MAKIDWDTWRKKFIQGPDELDLKKLSEYNGAPAYQTLRNRSSAEDWPDQRKRYRDNLGTLTSIVPDAQAVATNVTKIIDSAEMLTRHAQLSKLAGAIAASELKALYAKIQQKQPTGLRPDDLLKLAKFAVETERLTEGLVTERQEQSGNVGLSINVTRSVVNAQDA